VAERRARGSGGRTHRPLGRPARFAVRGGGQDGSVVLRPRLAGILWVVIGLVVAVSKDYLENVDTVKEILSAVLAILLWPLLLLGIDLHVR
jgi:hypothetical protein